MKSQILLDGESYLLTDRRGERGDAAFTRKLAHTDGRVADSVRRTGTRTSCGAERADAGTWLMVHAKTERNVVALSGGRTHTDEAKRE